MPHTQAQGQALPHESLTHGGLDGSVCTGTHSGGGSGRQYVLARALYIELEFIFHCLCLLKPGRMQTRKAMLGVFPRSITGQRVLGRGQEVGQGRAGAWD